MVKKKGLWSKIKNKLKRGDAASSEDLADSNISDHEKATPQPTLSGGEDEDFTDKLYLPVEHDEVQALKKDAPIGKQTPSSVPPPPQIEKQETANENDEDATILQKTPAPLQLIEKGPKTPDQLPLSQLAKKLTKGKSAKNFLRERAKKLPKIFKKVDWKTPHSILRKFGLKGPNLFDRNLWDKWMEDFFSPSNRPKIHRAFILFAIITFSYTAGKTLALLLAPAFKSQKIGNFPRASQLQREKDLLTQLTAIRQANPFNALETHQTKQAPVKQAGKKVINKNKVCHKASTPSSLPIKLLFTVVLQDHVKSLASVQKRGQKAPVAVREGDKIDDMAEIGRINRLNMVIKNLGSGECELIQNVDKKFAKKQKKKSFTVLPPGPGKKLIAKSKPAGITNEGNSFKIKKSYRNKMMGNMSEILTQARGIPIRNPDGTYAFKLEDIVPGSIYSHLNLNNGDTITHINGKKIANMNTVMSMFGKLKGIDNLSLTIQRNGNKKIMDYSFE